jgi:hypothetical protein
MISKINFLTMDNQIINMNYDIFINKCDFITLLDLEENNDNGENYEENIPINVTLQTMKFIEIYLTHHRETNIPIINKPLTILKYLSVIDNISIWDRNFIESLDLQNIYDLVNACNYLGIDSLKALCCAYLTTLLFRKRIHFALENPLTLTEHARISTEIKWGRLPNNIIDKFTFNK